MTEISPPADMAEMLAILTAQRKELLAARGRLRTAGPQAADLIAHAYDHMRDEAAASAKGGVMLRKIQKIDAKLGEIDLLIREMAGLTRTTSAAVQEFEAKQARAARSYQV
jgi:hypothetical protein